MTVPGERSRKHVWISGIVQGVNFRAATLKEARRAGVGGWVRNLPDGRVEAVFEGEARLVDQVVQWCRKGPPSARVTDVRQQDETPRGEKEFQVFQ